MSRLKLPIATCLAILVLLSGCGTGDAVNPAPSAAPSVSAAPSATAQLPPEPMARCETRERYLLARLGTVNVDRVGLVLDPDEMYALGWLERGDRLWAFEKVDCDGKPFLKVAAPVRGEKPGSPRSKEASRGWVHVPNETTVVFGKTLYARSAA